MGRFCPTVVLVICSTDEDSGRVNLSCFHVPMKYNSRGLVVILPYGLLSLLAC